MKTRIVKRTMPDGRIEYVIQQKHFLFFWWWVDSWMNKGVECNDSFETLEMAQKNLCYFNGTKVIDLVVH